MTDTGNPPQGAADGGIPLDRALAERGKLDAAQTLAFARQAAGALAGQVGRGNAHGKLAPRSLLITPTGHATILPASEPPADTPFEDTRYISPEQASGAPPDARSDIYSLGAVLYHVATGVPPFKDGEPNHVDGTIRWPTSVEPSVPEGLSLVIAKMMAKNPKERYQTATELILDLDIVLPGGEPVIAAKEPKKSTVTRPAAASKRSKKATRATRSTTRVPVPRPKSKTGMKKASGVRERVATRASATHRGVQPGPPASSGKTIAVVVGAVVALGLGGVLIMSGGGESSTLPPPPSTSSSLAAPVVPIVPVAPAPGANEPEDPAALALKRAIEYAAAHPDDVGGVVERFERFLADHPGTPHEADVKRRIAEARARGESMAERAFDAAAGRAQTFLGSADYDRAIQAFRSIPPGLAPLVHDRVDAEVKRIDADGRAALDALIEKAENAAGRGEVDAATEAVAEARRLRHREAVKAARQRIDAVAGRLEARAREREKLDAVLRQIGHLLDVPDYAGAHEYARKARSAEGLANFAAELAAVEKVFEALQLRYAKALLHAKTLVGRKLDLSTKAGTHTGEVSSATLDGITIVSKMVANGRVMGESRKQVAWENLTDAQISALAPDWKPEEPPGLIARAICEAGANNIEEAERLLRSAGAHPLSGYVRDKLDVARGKEVEVLARKEWGAIEKRLRVRKLATKEATAIAKAIEAFEKKYEKTAFLASLGERLEKARAAALGAADASAVARGKLVSADVGPVPHPGKTEFAGGVLKLTNAGTDIWGAVDEFRCFRPFDEGGSAVHRAIVEHAGHRLRLHLCHQRGQGYPLGRARAVRRRIHGAVRSDVVRSNAIRSNVVRPKTGPDAAAKTQHHCQLNRGPTSQSSRVHE